MSAANSFKNYKRAVELFLTRKDKALVFNSRIGWVVTGEHTRPLKSDTIRLTATDLNQATLNDDPAGLATWQVLSAKHNLNNT